MKVLVLGAGAVGGYFGGRLVEKGVDVTFLVREKRKKQLDRTGLCIKSIHGDFQTKIRTIVSGNDVEPYDVIILSVKAYHLQDALKSVSPYIGEKTIILPLLNGLQHVDKLRVSFGTEKVIGGLCFIETTLNDIGEIIQTSSRHDIVFGEFDQEKSIRTNRLADLFTGANFNMILSENINKAMWNKYIFITALSGMTCLMNSSIGPILEKETGHNVYQLLVHEICTIARASGALLDPDIAQITMNTTTTLSYNMKASMCKDMEKGLQIESEHLQGNLMELAKKYEIEAPILKTIYTKLSIYEKSH